VLFRSRHRRRPVRDRTLGDVRGPAHRRRRAPRAGGGGGVVARGRRPRLRPGHGRRHAHLGTARGPVPRHPGRARLRPRRGPPPLLGQHRQRDARLRRHLRPGHRVPAVRHGYGAHRRSRSAGGRGDPGHHPDPRPAARAADQLPERVHRLLCRAPCPRPAVSRGPARAGRGLRDRRRRCGLARGAVPPARVVRRRVRAARRGAGRPHRRVGGHGWVDGHRQRRPGLRPPHALQRRLVGRGRGRRRDPREHPRGGRRPRRDRSARRARPRRGGARRRPRRRRLRRPPAGKARRVSPLRLLARRGAELLAALIVASLVAALTLAAVDVLSFPEPSWLPETAGTLVAVAVVVVAGWLLLRLGAHGRGTGERPLWLLGVAGPALLASSHLGLLLHGTPHYLFGLGGDQANRVSALTRFADSPALTDAFYADAAPFYPPQWFWVGGQLARIAGVEAWLVYKPYAIATMAIAGAIAFVAWRWLVPTRLAVVLGMVTAVIGGHTNAYEPYSWILICLLPQAVVATHLLCVRVSASARTRAGPPAWPLVLTIGVYLGWAALGYTLIAGFAALVVALVVVSHVWRARTDRALAGALLARLAAMAAISAALALLFWHRFLLAVLGGAITERSVANDFAPESGSRLPLPMFEVSAAGALCLIGLVWIV